MALKTVQLQVYVYEGTSGSYSGTDLRYTLQNSLIGTDTNVVFEIAELVRDYLDLTFNNDYLSKTIWVTTVGILLDENNVVFSYGSPEINTYLATDGYGYFEDSVNPELSRDLLMTSNTIYLPEDTTGKLPLFVEGVGKIIIDSTTTQIIDSGNSNQKIQYITIPANKSSIKVYATNDSTLLRTLVINNVCEPKYSPYKITFTNKYGAYQDLWFFKKTVEAFNVTDEKYKRNTIKNATVEYNKYSGQEERYNTNATKSITLNTGFINEDSNSAIEELFLSENIWIRYNDNTLPLITKSKSMTFKTSLNDKLANYTVDFDFAFNKINNVR